MPPYRLLKFVYSSIDFFSYFELVTSKILLKSILKRKINPLITKNRFGNVSTQFGLFKQKKIPPISAPLFGNSNFPYVSSESFFLSCFLYCIFHPATKKLFQLKFDFQFKMWCKGTTRIFPIDSRLKMSNDFQLTFPFSAVCQSAEIILHTHNLPPYFKVSWVVFSRNKSWKDSFIELSETLILKES